MTPANELHFGLLQQANHTDSEYLKQLDVVQRDHYLNRAVRLIIEIYSGLAENNDTARQYLREITLRDVKLTAEKKDEYYLATLPENFYKPLELTVVATKSGCSNSRNLIVTRLPSNKLRTALKNANVKRFWDFERTVAIEAEDGYHVYHGGLDFGISLDYVRTIQDILGPEFENAGPYTDENGKRQTKNQDFEISHPDVKYKVISVAALMVKRDYGNIQDYQTQLNTILQIEKI